MTDGKQPIEPTKSYLLGVAVPGVIILGCAVVGICISLLNARTSPQQIWNAATFGAFWGFYVSLFGVFEMIAALLFSGRRFMNGLYISLGYLSVWLFAAFALGLF